MVDNLVVLEHDPAQAGSIAWMRDVQPAAERQQPISPVHVEPLKVPAVAVAETKLVLGATRWPHVADQMYGLSVKIRCQLLRVSRAAGACVAKRVYRSYGDR